jgi:hypothetical protein
VLVLFLVSIANADSLVRDVRDIPLTPSSQYLAIRLNSGVLSNVPNLEAAIKPALLVKNSAVLDQHGLTVIKVPLDAGFSIEKLRLQLAPFGTFVPVYERAGADVVLTNQIIFKLKLPSANGVIESIKRYGAIEPINKRGTYLLTLNDYSASLDISKSLSQRKSEIEYAEPNFVVITRVSPENH